MRVYWSRARLGWTDRLVSAVLARCGYGAADGYGVGKEIARTTDLITAGTCLCYQNEWDAGNCKGQRPKDKKMMKVLGKRGETEKWKRKLVCGLLFQAAMWPCDQSIGDSTSEIRSNTIGLLS